MTTHIVATEYGWVDLKGRSLRERAPDLIGIAHPKFRDELSATIALARLRIIAYSRPSSIVAF